MKVGNHDTVYGERAAQGILQSQYVKNMNGPDRLRCDSFLTPHCLSTVLFPF
jgi:hypothetical protein